MLNRTSRIAARLTRNSPVIRHYATQPQSPLYTGSADSRLVLKRNQYNPSKVLIGRIDKSSPPPHLFTLADLSPSQISTLLKDAIVHKHVFKNLSPLKIRKTLTGRTVALIFDKRSTRTRVASETAANALGGAALFMGRQDVQLGVNESMRDTAQVVGSMVDGIVARVNSQADIETLAKYSGVPVINALSELYHPTQILADLMALQEAYSPELAAGFEVGDVRQSDIRATLDTADILSPLQGKKVAWVGDTNNITNELLVTVPRLGMKIAVASPKGYDKVDDSVWARVTEAKSEESVTLTNSPQEALKDADIVVTDTWISMGQEEEKAARMSAFEGFQITNQLVESAGAKPDWKFIHCLPRHPEEVDDEVFYGPHSLVFPEAENRKWTTMACFDSMMGRWKL